MYYTIVHTWFVHVCLEHVRVRALVYMHTHSLTYIGSMCRPNIKPDTQDAPAWA